MAQNRNFTTSKYIIKEASCCGNCKFFKPNITLPGFCSNEDVEKKDSYRWTNETNVCDGFKSKDEEILRGDWSIEVAIDYGNPEEILILDIQMNLNCQGLLRTPAEFNTIINRHIERELKGGR